jgi:hypothetical protein
MSERRWWLPFLAVALTVGLPLAAQQTPQLEARLRRLEATKRALDDSVRVEAASEFARVPREFVTIDGIVFGYPAEVAAGARRAAEALTGSWSLRYGAALQLLRGDTAFLRLLPPRGEDGDRTELRWQFSGFTGSRSIPSNQVAAGSWLVDVPNLMMLSWEKSLFDPRLREWIGEPGPPVVGDEGLHDARIALLTSRSGPARRCATSDLRECRRVLALTPHPDPFTEWYDRDELTAWIRSSDIPEDVPGRAACLAELSAERCRQVLTRARKGIPPPTDAVVRGSIYRFALELGGPEALVRLASTRDLPPAEQLAVASGVPVDSLITMWHQALIAGSTARREGAGSGFLALCWILGLGVLFAWRYRWHHV